MVLSIEMESSAPKKVEFTPAELIEKTKTADRRNIKDSFFLELHRRFSLPAVCLLLAFLGPPLSLIAGKSGKLGGLALGLIVFSVYYILLMYGESLVMAGRLPHSAGAWAATFIIGIFAGTLFLRGNRR